MGTSHTKQSNAKMNSSSSKSDEKNEGQDHSGSRARPLSIEGPRTSNNGNAAPLQPVENQPRQPSDLQGLLRFAMEANQGQNSGRPAEIHPLDEERKSFLSEALSSMCVNVIEELQKAIKFLSNVIDLRPDDDPTDYENALVNISDYVGNMDVANDFYQIGGFVIFGPCLNSPHSSIRWRAADIIAELAQNNPFCQERILETGLFPILLGMIDSDPSEAARIKALYAVSCIVRGHPQSLAYMDINDGYSVLLRAMQSPIEKLQIKSAFLLSALCYKDNSDHLKTTLVNMGLIEQVAGLLPQENLLPETREQLLNILTGLTNNNFLSAMRECRRPELCLKTTLEQCLQELKPDEYPDEIDMCKQLLDKLFYDQEPNQER